MKSPALERTAPTLRHEAAVGAIAAVVVALIIVGVVVARGSGRDDGTPGAAAGTSVSEPATRTSIPPDEAVTTAPTMPEATAPTSDANVLPVALPSVGLDEPAASGDGVSAAVLSVEAIEGSGSGPGNISGPALRVTLELTNGTAAPVALDFVSVSVTHGTARTPASPLNDPSAAPFTGTLEPGATGEGAYVFSVPKDDRGLVTVSVGYRAGAPYLVFSGAAP
jgi:hypothetical protein